MSRMPRYYGSCPPQEGGLTSPTDLMPKIPGYYNSVSVSRPAPVSPKIPQQHPIMLVGAYGNRVPINRRTAPKIERAYASSNGEHPKDGAEAGNFDIFALGDSIDAIVRKEVPSRIREGGHHFGGYRPGKNLRQDPSVRLVGTVSEASGLFGLPPYELVSAGMTLEEMGERQRYKAWIEQVVAGNDHSI